MNDALNQLADDYWEFKLRSSPAMAHLLGDHRYDADFDEASRETEDRHIAELRRFAAEAEAIDPAGLTPDERISRETLMFEATTRADSMSNRLAEIAVNHVIGFQTYPPVIMGEFPVETAEHAEAMIEKYVGIARHIDQLTQRYREGLAAGRTPPRLMVEKTKKQLDEYLTTSLGDDPITTPNVPPEFDEAAIAEYLRRAADQVQDHIRPAYRRMSEFLGELAPHSRPDDRVGIQWIEGGPEAYAIDVHRHTSTDLTADQIHQIGLDTIATLADEYREMAAEALGTTDLAEIFSRLRDDPELHFDQGPPIREASEKAMGKAKAAMDEWFGRLPKADCVVKETQYGPTAFYQRPAADGSRPGTFYINTADPARWGRFEIEAMSYHEAIPGHHLQLAIAGELEGVPEFRKHARITAYAEGWGLYTERLADEMGLYSSPLDRIGMLSADSMRAARLVVDTGLHAKGWSRQQAIDYMRDNSPISLGTITGEIDRYIGMPGQALAYMIGRKEIMRIRAEAEATMGDRFDIKGFHDTVLGSGLVPLGVLDHMVAAWASA